MIPLLHVMQRVSHHYYTIIHYYVIAKVPIIKHYHVLQYPELADVLYDMLY